MNNVIGLISTFIGVIGMTIAIGAVVGTYAGMYVVQLL